MEGTPQIIIKTVNLMKKLILKRFDPLQKEVLYIIYFIKFSFTSILCLFPLKSILPFYQKGFNLKQEVHVNEIIQSFTVL